MTSQKRNPSRLGEYLAEPKNLGVKIGSKKEAFWQKVLTESKSLLEAARETADLQEEVIKIAERRVKEEQEAFKKK